LLKLLLWPVFVSFHLTMTRLYQDRFFRRTNIIIQAYLYFYRYFYKKL
jgi:hypothetical protein